MKNIAKILATTIAFMPTVSHARVVTASVYDPWYHGRPTACLTTYRHDRVSAAHPWLECGTIVTVRHRGRVLNVPITDRCDCGRIDLSGEAARRLGIHPQGLVNVHIIH